IELATHAGDRVELAHGHSHAGAAGIELYDVDAAQEHLRVAQALYEELGMARWTVGHLAGMVGMAALFQSLDDAVDLGWHFEALAESVDYDLGAAVGAVNLGTALSLSGRFAEAKAAGERAVERALRLDMPHVVGPAYGVLGVAERGLGDLQSALAHQQRAVEVQRSVVAIETLGDDLAELVRTYAMLGRTEPLPALADEAMALYEEHASRVSRPQALLWAAAQAAHAAGDEVRATALAAQARRDVEERAARITQPAARDAYVRFPPNALILAAATEDRWPTP
ncbi:MAG: tetratricopeptide repeat protein, partial [Candidatus Eremiobacteraeota bacterium]|nr:tetratricopeptide repeat protein [Candidatus Eremiobacteraeota bacterium]